ncbi:hypothetical protein [Persicitalea jodogahamensis]|uniref:Uncharacterized protein n=1 Tax=Persicitalea jodogahamensis TaxID=402147 RepID=A0A8J3D486_9BACT|nr:hypothetical protein [Persicitalea jodogahamensis]GHB72567.1 hypothetical protein GCM10007390_28300 [Persicitalea jodogahamensis]
MKKQLEFKLVKGDFLPEEAGKVLFSLIQNKINYHNVEMLSRQIRFGFDDDVSHSEKRIIELKEINESLAAFLREVGQEGKSLKIDGTFVLSLAD